MATLAQRQWRQRAQTAVRTAVTATKEARSRFQAASDAGDAALSDLSNCLLELSHLPALRLPRPLATLKPDVRAAAAAKLVRRLAALMEGVQAGLVELESSVAALLEAVASLDAVPRDEPWMRSAAVFHTMPLPRLRQLLAKVYDMYNMEYDSKAAVVAAVRTLAAGPATAAAAAAAVLPQAGGGGVAWTEEGGGNRDADVRGTAALAEVARQSVGGMAKRLPDLCTTYISVWMLSPYLEDEQADEALGAITDDMASF